MMNINLAKLMLVSPDELAKQQYTAIKHHAMTVLSKAIKLLDSDNLEELKSMCYESRAGDGWGDEDEPLNFGFTGKCLSLGHLIDLLSDRLNGTDEDEDEDEDMELPQ